MLLFEYGEKETCFLSRKDKKLGQIIEKIGRVERKITPNIFEAIIESILAQQISTKAAETVIYRFKEIVN